MIKDITLGQYYNTNSTIHSLDPRVKLVSTFVYLICLFIYKNILGYVLATIFLVVVIYLSKVPVEFIFRGLKSIFILLLITVCFNLFLTPGRVAFKFYFLKITYEGIKIAIFMALRLIYLIIGSQVMTLTTTPSKLTNAIEYLLSPLKLIKVPVHEIAMMMSIALRFIPILLDETNKIINSQISRGADLENGNIIKKAKAMIPILIPLFIAAFKRANDLALAMDARCYNGGENRTRLHPLKYVKRDYLAYAIIILYFGISICLNRVSLIPLLNI